MTSTKRARYLLKKRKHKSPSSVVSYLSGSNTTDTNSLDELTDEMVCTNCLESDLYLSQFCEELFYRPSMALKHLEGLMNNPEFPKSELDKTLIPESVPVITSLCVDCSTDDAKRYKYHNEQDCISMKKPFSINNAQNTTVTPLSSCNYEKERREIERQLINRIYELVCDQNNQSSNCQTSSDNSTHNSNSNNRVTKLFVSELAIKRMENIQKLNYVSQIERIKRKLLQSYIAFGKLDDYLLKHSSNNKNINISSNNYNNKYNFSYSSSELLKRVPYQSKVRELEKSLQIK